MQRLRVSNSLQLGQALNEALRHSASARFITRVECLLWVAGGCSCHEVGKRVGISPRAVELWVHRYKREGVGGLKDHRRGARGALKLTGPQFRHLENDVRQSPAAVGYADKRWNGRLVAEHLRFRYGVILSVRHGQRLLRRIKG